MLVAKKMTCLQQRKQHTSKKIMSVATKTTMCTEQRRQCATKMMGIASKKNEMRIIKGKGENTRNMKKKRKKQRKNMIYHRIITINVVWTMGLNVCCNEDVKCATTPNVNL